MGTTLKPLAYAYRESIPTRERGQSGVQFALAMRPPFRFKDRPNLQDGAEPIPSGAVRVGLGSARVRRGGARRISAAFRERLRKEERRSARPTLWSPVPGCGDRDRSIIGGDCPRDLRLWRKFARRSAWCGCGHPLALALPIRGAWPNARLNAATVG